MPSTPISTSASLDRVQLRWLNHRFNLVHSTLLRYWRRWQSFVPPTAAGLSMLGPVMNERGASAPIRSHLRRVVSGPDPRVRPPPTPAAQSSCRQRRGSPRCPQSRASTQIATPVSWFNTWCGLPLQQPKWLARPEDRVDRLRGKDPGQQRSHRPRPRRARQTRRANRP